MGWVGHVRRKDMGCIGRRTLNMEVSGRRSPWMWSESQYGRARCQMEMNNPLWQPLIRAAEGWSTMQKKSWLLHRPVSETLCCSNTPNLIERLITRILKNTCGCENTFYMCTEGPGRENNDISKLGTHKSHFSPFLLAHVPTSTPLRLGRGWPLGLRRGWSIESWWGKFLLARATIFKQK